MPKKSVKVKPVAVKAQAPSWRRALLALSLVPVIIGVFLIAAWALDIELWSGALEAQIWIGILFMLVGFSASNFLQGKLRLGIGWLLLASADLVLLVWVQFWAQMVALTVAVAGAALILFEFYKRIAEEGKAKTKRK